MLKDEIKCLCGIKQQTAKCQIRACFARVLLYNLANKTTQKKNRHDNDLKLLQLIFNAFVFDFCFSQPTQKLGTQLTTNCTTKIGLRRRQPTQTVNHTAQLALGKDRLNTNSQSDGKNKLAGCRGTQRVSSGSRLISKT